MTFQLLRSQTQFQRDLADLILVKRTERLDDAARLEQLLDAGDSVVVRLDGLGPLRSARFDGVGVDSALAKNPMPVQKAVRFDDTLLLLQELLTDDVPLALRVAHARQGRQETILRMVDLYGGSAERVEGRAHEVGLTFAHQASVDINAAHS